MADWEGLKRFLRLRRAGVPADKAQRALEGKTFVMEAEWLRSEELRPDRLGPSQDDVENPERVRVERWRPSRTLGPLK
jgi:hypothetical protein